MFTQTAAYFYQPCMMNVTTVPTRSETHNQQHHNQKESDLDGSHCIREQTQVTSEF